jgi:hypothetical protein
MRRFVVATIIVIGLAAAGIAILLLYYRPTFEWAR